MDVARRWSTALACALCCQAAHADRSRLADDADVIDVGECEIELAFERQTARGAAPERESAIQGGCGIGWRTELAASFTRRRSEGTRDEAIAIEGKTLLRARGAGGIGWTLGYGIGSERSDRGSWRRSEQFVAIEATHEPAPRWLVEAKLGTERDRLARSDRTLWSLAVEHAMTGAVEMRAELAGDDRTRPLASAALRYLVWPEHAVLTLAYGAAIGPLRERRLGLAVTFEF